jgi:uncharacterized protein involved in exopolysaccharide biosynthesis
MARIQEAKDIPVVSVIDAPGIPEKKSFPPRLLLSLALALLSTGLAAGIILLRSRWLEMSSNDPRRVLGNQIGNQVQQLFATWLPRRRGVQ